MELAIDKYRDHFKTDPDIIRSVKTEKFPNKLCRIIEECYPGETVIIETMTFPLYEKNQNIRDTLENASERGVKIIFIVSKHDMDLENQDNIIKELRDLHFEVIEVERESRKLLAEPGEEYWDDFVLTPSFLLYTFPHDPHAEEHTHEGFYSRDNKLVGREIYPYVLKLVENIRLKRCSRFCIEYNVAKRLVDHNFNTDGSDSAWLKEKLADMWISVGPDGIRSFGKDRTEAIEKGNQFQHERSVKGKSFPYHVRSG